MKSSPITNTQYEMIKAADSIVAMIPAKPVKVMGDRTEQLVQSVFVFAAKAAYLRAAQECLNAAYDAASGGLDLEAAHAMIADPAVNLQNLITMCQPGYAWGGSVVTL